MPTLETPRLILRDFQIDDWDAVNAFLADLEVTRYMHFAHWTEAQRREWLEGSIAYSRQPNPEAHNWAIVLRASGAVIGWLGIGNAGQPATVGERDFGYALDRRHWNQGYMTEALKAVLAYEFQVRGTRRIIATCEVPNRASARVMEKAGMRHEGTFDDVDFEGNRALRHRYTMDADEYAAQSGKTAPARRGPISGSEESK